MRPRTLDSVKSQVRLQLDIWCPPAPGLTCCRTRFCKFVTGSHFLMNHEDTKSPRAAITVPLCLRAFVVERICGKFMGDRKGSTLRQCSIVFATVSFRGHLVESACQCGRARPSSIIASDDVVLPHICSATKSDP